MIKIDKATKYFGAVLAVKDFSLEIRDGEVCVLIGPSGCGKTTVLKMINRLVIPTSGNIFINNIDIKQIQAEQLRRSIGYVIQNVGLFPHMTVKDNIGVVPRLNRWDSVRLLKRTCELLELVGLKPDEYINKYPIQLSGGEAQRVGVARALAADPPILLMDEPFGAVDPLNRERLQTQFQYIQKELKKTVIFVTHDLDEAIRLADNIAVMKSGQLVQYDTPEKILSAPANKFVRDFVGSDRALKKLSRLSIEPYIRETKSILISSTVEEAFKIAGSSFSVWLLNEQGQLIGWADRDHLKDSSTLSEAAVLPDIKEIAIRKDTTMRQALSLMLGQGVKSLPVIDQNGGLSGEISLSDIEEATAEKSTLP